jgi:hypothetical protein
MDVNDHIYSPAVVQFRLEILQTDFIKLETTYSHCLKPKILGFHGGVNEDVSTP